MRNFDERFKNPPDYILGITQEIWEDRGVDRLHDYYTVDIPVRSPDGAVIGNEAVIDATWATLAEFPDRQLLGEDVIWSDDGEGGFLSSHRIFSTATHLGDGSFGPATGTQLRYRVIADCAARNNQIYDEWLVRDLGAIVAQLGYTPRAFAERQLDADIARNVVTKPLMSQNEPAPVYTGIGNDHPLGAGCVSAMRSLLASDRDDVEGVVNEWYDRAVQLDLPGGVTGHGWADAAAFWVALGEAFPAAELTVHHTIGRDDEALGTRAALRWSLHGTHDGPGYFGEPSGAPVHVMGITHLETGPWGVRREFVLFDQIAVWKQILLHQT